MVVPYYTSNEWSSVLNQWLICYTTTKQRFSFILINILWFEVPGVPPPFFLHETAFIFWVFDANIYRNMHLPSLIISFLVMFQCSQYAGHFSLHWADEIFFLAVDFQLFINRVISKYRTAAFINRCMPPNKFHSRSTIRPCCCLFGLVNSLWGKSSSIISFHWETIRCSLSLNREISNVSLRDVSSWSVNDRGECVFSLFFAFKILAGLFTDCLKPHLRLESFFNGSCQR